ncbi:hypothetical protein [Bacillus pumilus]|uniref:hypothetical protein n=1 Tax=Bacillus pumilus TaxID=1408 RepID=UPI0011A80F2F|nr:hypothetical protein [Bacillus pumilus]
MKLKEGIDGVVDKGREGLEVGGEGVKGVNERIDEGNEVIDKGIEKRKERADSLIKGGGDLFKGGFCFG